MKAVSQPFTFTELATSVYSKRIHLWKSGPKLNFSRVLKRKSCDTLSNAFSWSTEIRAKGVSVSFAYVIASCISHRLSFIVRPGMHAVWSVCTSRGSVCLSRFASALVRIL